MPHAGSRTVALTLHATSIESYVVGTGGARSDTLIRSR